MTPTPELIAFIEKEGWTFAKTMPQWPHEYLVRNDVDEQSFISLVEHIRAHGAPGSFYKRELTFYHFEGWVYWTMGNPVEETTIINRCLKENTYEHRLKMGSLPK